jgi:hypothetical protein
MSENIKKPNTILKIRKTLYFYVTALQRGFRNFIFPIVNPKFERPIFIIGCSRSGTTVIYKVLSMATGLASMQKESHEFWNSLHPPSENGWDSHMLLASHASERDRQEVSRFFYRHIGSCRFIDKANQNCFRISYLYALFPSAYFVYVKRDGRDNINSLIHGWGRPGEFGNWSYILPADVQIDNGKYRRWCFFLFPGWKSFLKASIEDVCAKQWIEANEAVLSAKHNIPPSQWIEVFYEDIIHSPVETFQKLFEQLNLTFSDEIKRHCDNLASKPYNAFSRPRLNKWKEENRERIERITPKISETMRKIGYKI